MCLLKPTITSGSPQERQRMLMDNEAKKHEASLKQATDDAQAALLSAESCQSAAAERVSRAMAAEEEARTTGAANLKTAESQLAAGQSINQGCKFRWSTHE